MIVFIFYDIEEVVKIGGCIGIMKDGCLIQVGMFVELIQMLVDVYVQDFFCNVDVLCFLKVLSMMMLVECGLFCCDVGMLFDCYLNQLIDSGVECGYVCDEFGCYFGCVMFVMLYWFGMKLI